MPFDSRAIANEYLKIAFNESKKLDPLKLQKLLYFAHGWNLAIQNEPLVDEYFEAWKLGPVVPSVYHEFKRFGSGTISDIAKDMRMVGGKFVMFPYDLSHECKEAPQRLRFTTDLLRRVWSLYKNVSGLQLSQITHADGSPWAVTWGQANGRRNADIPDELIREYFIHQARSREKE